MKKHKIGLDIHGVIDKHQEFFKILSHALVDAGHEVHIITGISETKEVIDELTGYGLKWTHFFSITDHHLSIGTEIEYDGQNRPYMDPHKWDKTKGWYCKEHGIDMHFDDSNSYHDHFETPYLLMLKKDKNE